MKRINRNMPTALSLALFAVFAFALLWGAYGLYMRKTEGLTLFLGSASYMRECMAVPGGIISWASTWLTQMMHLPWLGALIFAALLAALQWAAACALKLPKAWRPAAAIVPAMALLAYLRLGYGIFTIKPMGYAYAIPIGTLIAVGIMWLYGKQRRWWVQAIYLAIIIIVGYPLFGFYALAGAGLCAISGISQAIRGKAWMTLVPAVVAIALMWAVPQIWFYYAPTDVMRSHMYLSGLPRYYSTEHAQWVILAVLFGALAVGTAFAGSNSAEKAEGKKSGIAAWAVWAASVAAVLIFRCDDHNFMLTLKLDDALWQQDWRKAADLAMENDQEPTRINTALGYIALMRTGECSDRMFAMRCGWAPYRFTRNESNFSDADAALLSYHLGLPNYAYKWATEYGIEQSMGVERLKLLAKNALLNYEPELARTYLDILYNTPFHREWAKRYMRFLKEPMLMPSDPEFAVIMPLMCVQNQFINDNGSFEGYVWPLLANSDGGSPQFAELCLQAALISKNLDRFMARLPDYASTHGRLPRHFQEAAVLWAALNNAPLPPGVDPAVAKRHEQFLQAFRSSSHQGIEAEQQREVMRTDYGDTYWHYFIFTDDKPLI